MDKSLFTVDELIEADCFTLEEYLKHRDQIPDHKTKPWKVFQSLAKEKGVTSESLFENADNYFNDNFENQ